MTWSTNTSTSKKVGRWTCDVRHGYRSDREENTVITDEENEIKKNSFAIIDRAKVVNRKWHKIEDAKERATRATANPGVIVRAIKNLYSEHVDKSPSIFKAKCDRQTRCSSIIKEGAIGVFVGKTRVNATHIVNRRPTTMNTVVYTYIFGTRVYYFTLPGTEFLDSAIDESDD